MQNIQSLRTEETKTLIASLSKVIETGDKEEGQKNIKIQSAMSYECSMKSILRGMLKMSSTSQRQAFFLQQVTMGFNRMSEENEKLRTEILEKNAVILKNISLLSSTSEKYLASEEKRKSLELNFSKESTKYEATLKYLNSERANLQETQHMYSTQKIKYDQLKKSRQDSEKIAKDNAQLLQDHNMQQEDRIRQQEDRIRQQEDRIKQQEDRIRQQEDRIRQQEDSIRQQEDHITEQERGIKLQKDRFTLLTESNKVLQESLTFAERNQQELEENICILKEERIDMQKNLDRLKEYVLQLEVKDQTTLTQVLPTSKDALCTDNKTIDQYKSELEILKKRNEDLITCFAQAQQTILENEQSFKNQLIDILLFTNIQINEKSRSSSSFSIDSNESANSAALRKMVCPEKNQRKIQFQQDYQISNEVEKGLDNLKEASSQNELHVTATLTEELSSQKEMLSTDNKTMDQLKSELHQYRQKYEELTICFGKAQQLIIDNQASFENNLEDILLFSQFQENSISSSHDSSDNDKNLNSAAIQNILYPAKILEQLQSHLDYQEQTASVEVEQAFRQQQQPIQANTFSSQQKEENNPKENDQRESMN